MSDGVPPMTTPERCRLKRSYATEREARDAKKETRRHPGLPAKLEVYKCNVGDHWHLTKRGKR